MTMLRFVIGAGAVLGLALTLVSIWAFVGFALGGVVGVCMYADVERSADSRGHDA